ncbi:MAG: UDP-N-acetylmuramoyl-L-alanine--D-glutamate ligase [Lachnospiraceae bacterium]|nr:UDP-N-acetylmuramoyl-L-alanine--D-glutamate ligase [Lachnospiraceae bacterium]
MKTIKETLENKRILIWGYGREGKSTEAFIQNHIPVQKLDVYEGSRDGFNEEDYDYIIKSPGIVYFTDSPKYISQTILFMNEFGKCTIGITGTKGKSTTSSLMYEVIKACGRKTVLLGNIGKPCLDLYDEIDDETLVVFELSCHQLSKLEEAPKYAMFLNLFEEHLDYYKTVDKYYAAKANITTHQTEADFCLLGENVPMPETKARTRVVNELKHDLTLQIPGDHNLLNAEFVYTMAVDILGLNADNVKTGLESFTGLNHRLQYFTTRNGVRYYDDSISTIPEATINAVKAVPGTGVVLVGGMDRGIDYSILVDFIKKTPDVQFVLMYDTGARILQELGDDTLTNVHKVSDLAEAVNKAKELAGAGSAVVLSPAAASYGVFKNFEERGDRFKELVNEN